MKLDTLIKTVKYEKWDSTQLSQSTTVKVLGLAQCY